MRTPAENAEHGVSRASVLAYEAGELDSNQIISLGQNVYEAGLLPKLPPRYFLLIEHLKRVGLLYAYGRPFH